MTRPNPPLAPWDGRRVWIVGASSGIGRAVAQALLARGAHLIVSGRSEEALAQLAAGRAHCTPLALDVLSGADVDAAARQVLQGGPPELLVYCAGRYLPMRATALDLGEMLHHDDVNYRGALRVLAAVLPSMLRARRGHVSLVGSLAGYMGLPNGLAYGPTKAALINLAETLHMDLRPHGLGVSIVNPGFVETPMTAVNRFRMPALLTPPQAADAMVRGWSRGDFEIHFPRPFSLAMKTLSLLPFGARRALVRRVTGL